MSQEQANRPGRPGPEKPIRVHSYALIIAILWTVVVGGSLLFNITNLERGAGELALLQARTAFDKDVSYRRWNSDLGGFFVKVTDKTQPNPYINPTAVERDLTTPGGRRLTLINPAYMTRLVQEVASQYSPVLSRVTSSNPIRPANGPDDWEAAALKKLEKGEAGEVVSIQPIQGQDHLRLMRPLITEKSCLVCHAGQGYKEGEVRGGLSVAVPMAPFTAYASSSGRWLAYSHLGLWLLGLAALGLGADRLAGHIRRRHEAEQRLLALTGQLEERVEAHTERLRRRHLEMNAFLNNTQAGVFMKNDRDQLLMVNPRLATLLNAEAEALLGTDGIRRLPPEIARQIREMEKQILSRERTSVKADIHGESESALGRVFNVNLFPLFNETGELLMGVGGIILDITDRHNMEQALVAARDAAEEANRAKTKFLANISHEIRTPLNGVLGMADLLARGGLNPDQLKMAETISASGEDLLNVLNDILDYAKIEAGRLLLNPEPFRLRELIHEVADALAPPAHRKGLEMLVNISPKAPDGFVGDPARLKRMLQHLLGNAVKFTEKGEVAVTVRVLEEKGRQVKLRLSVTDTGAGIPEEKRTLIFEAFEQGDGSPTRRHGGAGLGLAISRDLARLMGSSLEFESREGRGSAFWVDLQLPLAPDPAPEEPPFDPARLRGVKLLYADENSSVRRLAAETLAAGGVDVRLAATADEALQSLAEARAAAEPFQILAVGQSPPGGEAPELVRLVREEAALTEMPIIILAAGEVPPRPSPDPRLLVLRKPPRPEALFLALAFCLDLGPAPPGGPETARPADPLPPPGLKVLLVEDTEINRLVARQMLKKLGCEVSLAHNGQQGVEMNAEGDFDLILMDIQMPVMDGVTALERIRASGGPAGRRPVVALTAHALEGDRDRYLAQGFDGYLTKPVTLRALAKGLGEVAERFGIKK